jgi:hypothetical protein
MKLRHALLGAALLAGVGAASLVHAAGLFPLLPLATTITGAETIPCDTNLANGLNPQTELCTPGLLSGSLLLQSSPLTGVTETLTSNRSLIVDLTPAGTIAANTVVFPNAPSDGQRIKIFSSQIISALTLTAGTGQTITGTVTAMTANGSIEFVYQASSLTWFRSQ